MKTQIYHHSPPSPLSPSITPPPILLPPPCSPFCIIPLLLSSSLHFCPPPFLFLSLPSLLQNQLSLRSPLPPLVPPPVMMLPSGAREAPPTIAVGPRLLCVYSHTLRLGMIPNLFHQSRYRILLASLGSLQFLVCVCSSACLYVCLSVRLYVCMSVRLHVCMSVWTNHRVCIKHPWVGDFITQLKRELVLDMCFTPLDK